MSLSSRTFVTLLLLTLAATLPRSGAAQPALITIDDDFSDWSAVPVQITDPGGDASPGQIDFARLWVADDDRFLFLRIEVGIEIDPSENNDLRLYIDGDGNASTGLAVAGLGAELEWRFGSRNGTFFVGGSSTVFHDDLRFRAAPAVTDSEIEIALGRDARPDGSNLLFSASTIRVAFRDGTSGDQVPDTGQVLSYTFDQGQLPPDPSVPLDREASDDLRIITYNVLNDSPWDPGSEPRFGRQLAAVDPDILNFQEIRDHTAAETETFVSNWVTLDAGQSWYSAENSDCKTVSRYPVLGSWSLDGNLAVLLDTTTAISAELLVINAHLPCCGNDSGRQGESDRIMAFLRDAKAPGGTLTLDPDTPILITGDLNLVGLSQQLTTLLTGDIVNPGFGADFDPDWDGTPLTNVISRQTEKRMGYTWRNDSSSFWPGHLDYHIYSDSVLELKNHYLLYTPEMADPASFGLQAQDSEVSDHLLFVADFAPVAQDPELTTNPPPGGALDFGPIRVGETAQANVEVTNTGGAGTELSGTFPAATGDFAPGTALPYGPLSSGVMVSRQYEYHPLSRGSDAVGVTVTSDAGDSSFDLQGTGVGPVFASGRAPGSRIAVPPSGSGAASLVISNVTPDPDGGDASRTTLTLRSVTITGPVASRLSLGPFTTGTTLLPGQSLTLQVLDLGSGLPGSGSGGSGSSASRPVGRTHRSEARGTATLTIETDEGAPLDGQGAVYAYSLRVTR